MHRVIDLTPNGFPMWPDTPVARLFRIAVPIILAPMAGEASTPELAAAVSNAGGLGSLGAAYSQPSAIRDMIRATRALTPRPFGVNLFIPSGESPDSAKVAQAWTALAPWRDRYGVADALPSLALPDFDAQLAVVTEEKPPVFSFAFGTLPGPRIAALKAAGIVVVGTATTVPEAERLEADGVDAIVAQGAEAGAHRGTFLGAFDDSLVGLMALVPAMVDRVRVPVIAAGGIMDGRGVAAALMLGATAVQLGTAFLVAAESGASTAWKQSVLAQTADATRITRAFSGRAARGISNRFMAEIGSRQDELPGFPALNYLTRGIRAAAAKAGDAEALSLWAGQGAPLARPMQAGELVRLLIEETSRRLDEGFQG